MNKQIEELLESIDVNAKIRLLAEQAGCSIDRLGYGEGNLEKFAELIIKETLQVARAGIEFGDGMEDAVYKYFGVEE